MSIVFVGVDNSSRLGGSRDIIIMLVMLVGVGFSCLLVSASVAARTPISLVKLMVVICLLWLLVFHVFPALVVARRSPPRVRSPRPEAAVPDTFDSSKLT